MSVVLKAPPPPELRARGGDSGWKEIARTADDIETHLLVGIMTEAGIETRVVKDRSGNGAWLYGGSDPWAPSTIFVRSFEVEPARMVLVELAWDEPTAERASASHGNGDGRTVAWWVIALILGILFTGIGLVGTARMTGNCPPIVCGEAGPP